MVIFLLYIIKKMLKITADADQKKKCLTLLRVRHLCLVEGESRWISLTTLMFMTQRLTDLPLHIGVSALHPLQLGKQVPQMFGVFAVFAAILTRRVGRNREGSLLNHLGDFGIVKR